MGQICPFSNVLPLQNFLMYGTYIWIHYIKNISSLLLVDVNKKTKTHDGRTPLELALQKCHDCLDKGASNEIYHGIAITLMKSDATVDGVEKNVLRLAVNFPVILKNILERHPQY